MNTSVEESRKIPINNFKYDIVNFDANDISVNDSEMENFYLDTSGINESLLEQYYAAEIETIHFNGSSQLPPEIFESNVLNSRKNICSAQSDQSQSKQVIADDKSIFVNCKTFCSDLLKPIKSKIIKKLVKKSTTDKSQKLQSFEYSQQNFQMHAQPSTQTIPLNSKSRRVQFKLVPSVQPAHLNINPEESTKPANNRFSNLGDIVYYDI